MVALPSLGVVVATHESPTTQVFHFVISDIQIRSIIETGAFVQVRIEDELALGTIQILKRENRYFSSPDRIHGSSQGMAVPSVFPADRWDYIIAEVKVLGSFTKGQLHRAAKPVIPGSDVEFMDEKILCSFLGIDPNGLNLGRLRQTTMDARINLDRLLQKHLAILSISGGGKSYTTSVILEELLLRTPHQGRPAMVLFDVHGEYRSLETINNLPTFHRAKIKRIKASNVKMAIANISASDLKRFFPAMSYPQQRDIETILRKHRYSGHPVTLETIINDVYAAEINQLVKDALLGWLNQLRMTALFSNADYPNFEEELQPGTLLIVDLAEITSLWKKRIIVHYFLNQVFELRRNRKIPPVINFLEEAHQFAPELESSAAKSIIHTIAREGRKFLCSLVLISQRPINLSTTALSQCNSHLILKIVNPHDLTYISKSSEGINAATTAMISSLGVGEGLLVGQAVNYPVFINIRQKITKTMYDEASLSQESMRFEKIENSAN